MAVIRILIMGLPGSGKTTLAIQLREQLGYENCTHLNADDVRRQANDWAFDEAGRIRQANRMFSLASTSTKKYVIADFVAPLEDMRHIFEADWTVWVDTIKESRYENTNKAFVEPEKYDFRITEQDAVKWAGFISSFIIENQRRPVFDWKKPTVQMLGRWQPWHVGHRALFERAIKKTGQVVIQIRDCEGWQDNPFGINKVKCFIKRDLDTLYQGTYEIQVVPNIVNITYGRAVGYKIEEEVFDESISSISATQIRKELVLT